MKIVFLDALTLGDIDLSIFNELGEVVVYQTTKKEDVIKRVRDADIIITNKVVIDKEVINSTLNLKLIQIAATGMNNVDVDYAKLRGIEVLNVAGYSTNSVVQHTFALVLSLLNRICYFDKFTKKEYKNSEIFTHIQDWFEIYGKTWGIIGLGTIGKEVAKIAKSFGAKVIYYSTSGKNFDRHYQRVELNYLLQDADIITIHAPLNEKSKNLLNKDNLKFIKDRAILVNVGRGGIINENDLASILRKKDIFVGLDVFEKEPINSDNPLLDKSIEDKLILTPHIAWTSKEARMKLIKVIYNNIKNFLRKSD